MWNDRDVRPERVEVDGIGWLSVEVNLARRRYATKQGECQGALLRGSVYGAMVARGTCTFPLPVRPSS